jgi:hypothetical protein
VDSADASPFLVIGRVESRLLTVPAYSTETAEQIAQSLAQSVPDSQASWLIRPIPGSGPGEPVRLFGRIRPGLIGETRRVVHTFTTAFGVLLPDAVITACGVKIVRASLDFSLTAGQGMPCERCLFTLPTTPGPSPELET